MGPPKNTTAEEGAKVKLECQAEASPSNITYRWFKDGEDVQARLRLIRALFVIYTCAAKSLVVL